MFYSTTDGQYISEGQAFTINGVQYPQNWLNLSTPEEKAQIGLEEVIATNQPANDQYYWVSTELNGASLTYINTPKDLNQCKVNAVSQIRSTAYSLLFPTDWMVVKAFETSTPIDPNWNTWRQSIRDTAQTYITTVEACTTIDELANLPSIQWPNDPNTPIAKVANE